MGQVIQMFKAPPAPNQPFQLEQVLTEDMEHEFHSVSHGILELWQSDSEAEFWQRIHMIKQSVARWPGGQQK